MMKQRMLQQTKILEDLTFQQYQYTINVRQKVVRINEIIKKGKMR